MSWMAWSTGVAAAVGLVVWLHEWRTGEPDFRRGQRGLARAGVCTLAAVWLVLVPMTVILWSNGASAPWLFGAETYDGGVVETVTTLGLLVCGLLAAFEAVRSRRVVHVSCWVAAALMATLAFGEEASWGQHLFRWSATGVFATENLQAETNLHNFLSPRLYDVAYAAVGWCLIIGAAVTTLRPRWMGALLKLVPFQHASPTGVAFLVSSGILLQHEVFEEMAEAVAILAVAFIQARFLISKSSAARHLVEGERLRTSVRRRWAAIDACETTPVNRLIGAAAAAVVAVRKAAGAQPSS